MVQRKYIQILTTLTAAFASTLVASVQEAHAADVDFSVVVSEVPVLEITLFDSTDITPTTISQNIKPNPDGTPTFTTSDIYVTVATSNPTGYYLNMHTSSTSLTSGTSEIPSLDNEYTCTINTASSCAFTNNSWGYRLSTDTANTYKPIPNSTGEDIDSYDTVTNGRTVNVILGTKIDSSLPAGSYATTISFVATANKVSPRYMQDITIDDCLTGGNTVYDRRDERAYTIKKIDGVCIMTKNLYYTGGKDGAISAGNAVSSAGLEFTMSNSTTLSYTAPYYYDSGNEEYGAYYNYCALSGKTVCAQYTSSVASASICPAGWKIPEFNSTTYAFGGISLNSIVASGDFNTYAGWYDGWQNKFTWIGEYANWWAVNSNGGDAQSCFCYKESSPKNGCSAGRQYIQTARCVLDGR